VRRLTLVLGLAACGDDGSSSKPGIRTFEFGPYALAAGQEINNQCVSAKLDNDEPLYVSSVELTTGSGFHHSNWFWVPDHLFDGEDGTWDCDSRGYDEASAGFQGGVVYAQSTQATHEIQAFPPGVAIVIPARSRILAGTHLLNQGDEAISVPIALAVTTIAEPKTKLAGMGFVNESITIPPLRDSRMTLECDLGLPHQNTLSRPLDFSIYYALAHYHELGTGVTLEAVRADGTSDLVFETVNRIGDVLGGPIEPAFSLAGYAKLRFACHFTNPRNSNVRWGVGDKEMCAFLAFTDSELSWSGGALTYNVVPTTVDHGSHVESTYACTVISSEAHL
jgi:hypothetical protein